MSKKHYLIGGLLIVLLTIVYSNHFDNGFYFDDSHTIVDNAFIRDIKHIPRYFYDATTFSALPSNQSYRPMVSTTLAIDYWLGGGLNPFTFHLSTFLLFILQAVLMFWVFRRMMEKVRPHPWNDALAMLAVAWYMFHPVQAETINYIISRSDSLSTLAIVGALWMFMRGGASRRYGLYLIPYLLGLLAKPTAVMFAPILWVYIWLFEHKLGIEGVFQKDGIRKVGQTFWATAPVWILGLGFYVFQDRMTPNAWIPGGNDPIAYLMTQPWVMLYYFRSLFSPTGLNADTDWELVESVGDSRFGVGLLFVGAFFFWAYRSARKDETRPIAFGIFWFFLALLPTSSIIPLSEVVNDHRMFFPYVGLVLAVIWWLGLQAGRFEGAIMKNKGLRMGLWGLACVALIGYSVGTWQRNEVWGSDETLWKDVTKKSPMNGRGWMNYGLSQMKRGRYPEALLAFNEALKYTPNYSYLHINLGILHNAMGNDGKTVEAYFKRGQELNPQLPMAYFYYGDWLGTRKRYVEAAYQLEKALELSEGYKEARYRLMTVYDALEEYEKVKAVANRTLELLPGDEIAQQYLAKVGEGRDPVASAEEQVKQNPTADNFLSLSLRYYQKERYEDCVAAAKKALEIQPEYAEAYNNICSAYNMMKEWEKALEACNEALRIKPDFNLAKNNKIWAESNLSN